MAAPGAWGYGLLLVLAVLGTFLLVIPSLAASGGDRLIAYGVAAGDQRRLPDRLAG